MSTHYRLDRESFEALLANVFAVQESGLDEQSLASLVEIQQFIASEKFDFNDEMRMVAERVLKLSKANGVAIALLHANQLLYCAGVGSATKEIGHRITAVLNVSSPGILRQEILRVEDAAKDRRIESDICRQFGARSLLMLPICENGVLRGVLQLSFDDAHSFPDREIRIYRLMAGALEEGILRRQQLAEKRETRGFVAQACEVKANSHQGLQSSDESVTTSIFPASDVGHNVFQVHGPTSTCSHLAREQSQGHQVRPALARQSPPLAVLRAACSSRVSSPNILLWCFRAALGAAAVLSVMIWISGDNHTISSTGRLTAPALLGKDESSSGKLLSAKQEPTPRSDFKETVRNVPEFKHVRISAEEVDDIAEDVTIRHFTSKALKPQLRKVVKEVNLGDDVTVRYFANRAPAVFNPSLPGRENNLKLRQP